MPIVEEFLFGSAISSFQCSLAWNGGQGGQLTCTLVDDPSVGTSFNPPSVGTPVYFSYSNFPYAGIFRNYIRELSAGGGATYRVDLTDIGEIVGNAQVILNGYAGSSTVQNLFNVYGYLESFGYGNAQVIEAGMPYNKLIEGLSAVANEVSDYGSPLTYMGYLYYIDFSELPQNLENYFIGGDVINLLDLISQICADNSLDFFFRMRLDSNGRNVIYVKTISRVFNAQPGRIDAFIAANTAGAVATTKGVELRNETTSKVVLGDNVLETRQFQTTFPSGYASTTAGVTLTGSQITFDNNYPKYYVMNPTYEPSPSNRQFPLCFPHKNKIVELRDNDILPFFGTDIMGFQYAPVKAQQEKDYIEYLKRCFNGTDALPGYIERTYTGADNSSNTQTINVGRSVISSMAWYHDNVFFPSTIPSYPYYITIGELRCALESQDCWEDYVVTRSQMIRNANKNRSGMSSDDVVNKHAEIYMAATWASGQWNITGTRADALKMAGVNSPELDEQLNNIINLSPKSIKDSRRTVIQNTGDKLGPENLKKAKIYNNVQQLAGDCYGRKFIIRLRDVFVKLNEQLRPFFSDDPSSEGYSETDVLNLNQFEQLFFKTQEGKLESFVEFDSVDFIDLTRLNSEDYFIKTFADPRDALAKTYTNRIDIDELFVRGYFGQSARLYLRCTVEPYLVFGSYFISLKSLGAATDSISYDDVRVIVTLSSPVYFRTNCTIDGIRSADGQAGVLPTYAPNAGTYTTNQLSLATGRVLTTDETRQVYNLVHSVSAKLTGQQIAAGVLIPRAAAFGMRSNVRSYGPWQAQGAAGKVDFEKDSNLNPWTFNGFDNMDLVGNFKAQGAVSNMQYTETGSVEVPGAPIFELGDLLITAGPVITDIGVNVSPNGVTTNYNMRTFTPSFGEVSRKLQEEIRQNTKRTIANQPTQKVVERTFAGKAVATNSIDNSIRRMDIKLGTPHEMIVAEVTPVQRYVTSMSGAASGTSGTPIVVPSGVYYEHNVCTETLVELRPELTQNYTNMAGMSLEGLYRPYAIGTGPSGMTRMSVQQPHASGNINLMPFGESGVGHDISYVIRGSGLPEDLNVLKGGYDSNNTYRGIGFKFPMIGVGWGYDLDDNPVPIDPSGSRTNPSGNIYNFHPDYLNDPSLWKAGPVDLRWSENQKMWVAPTSTNNLTTGLIPAVAQEAIQPYGSGHIITLTTTTASGNMAASFLGQPICSGQRMFVTQVPPTNLSFINNDINLDANVDYLIVISEYSNLTVPTNIRCASGNLVYDSANIYFPAAYSLTVTSG